MFRELGFTSFLVISFISVLIINSENQVHAQRTQYDIDREETLRNQQRRPQRVSYVISYMSLD